jgi:hypothetical protein
LFQGLFSGGTTSRDQAFFFAHLALPILSGLVQRRFKFSAVDAIAHKAQAATSLHEDTSTLKYQGLKKCCQSLMRRQAELVALFFLNNLL